MRHKIFRIIGILLLLAGIAVWAAPYVAQQIYQSHADQVAANFNAEGARLAELYAADSEASPYLRELYAAMQAYNKEIYENKQVNLKDPFSYEQASFDLRQWGFAENLVGYINIPRMRVTLPIYLGATVENMRKGAVHLSQTSLPIGGENTNTVLAAHRGSWAGAMFRDIEKLQIGDEITVTNLWATLTYRVAELKVISPNDIHEVYIQGGRELVTLITCHPYRHNYQRYVVYCERVTASGAPAVI